MTPETLGQRATHLHEKHRPPVRPQDGQYTLLIESEYMGDTNCADELYESDDIDRVSVIIAAICRELIKLDAYHVDGLHSDDLIVGLDTGPYNFMMKSGQAYYVDFYPPRHRTGQGKRLHDADVITDYPEPRDAVHGKHLLYCFYTRNGLWIHLLSHLWAALDSNDLLKDIWHATEQNMLEQIYKLLKYAGLHERVGSLQDEVTSPRSRFQNLRTRFYRHRRRYYQHTNGGFYLNYKQRIHNLFRKYYLASKTGTPFTFHEGRKMLHDCRRYYTILQHNVGMLVPRTHIELLEREP